MMQLCFVSILSRLDKIVDMAQAQISDYVLLVLYRYRLHREWTYLDVSPQLHFPRGNGYRASPMLSVRLEILFDQSR